MVAKSTKNTTKKKTTTKKKETKKDTVAIEYSPFIKTYLFEKISNNLPRIIEICKKYEGIEPMGLKEWEFFDKLVLEISKMRVSFHLVVLMVSATVIGTTRFAFCDDVLPFFLRLYRLRHECFYRHGTALRGYP